MTRIPFNKPFIGDTELDYLRQLISSGRLESDGEFTRRCARLLESQFHFPRVMMTSSCTAALEIAALLCDLGPGDEVIVPSFTFVSTASAIARTGASPVFVDIRADTLNLDEALIEGAVTSRTKAIFPVHYAGVGCAMDRVSAIAAKHGLLVVEDAAHAVNSYLGDKPLGSFGHLATFSFHNTKTLTCGEGGALCVNDSSLEERAEILRDKGTDRQRFLRDEGDYYTWVDLGSSYVMSELCSAFLLGQLESLEQISDRRQERYNYYMDGFASAEAEGLLSLPRVPLDSRPSHHIFHVLLPSRQRRDELMRHFLDHGVHAVIHYIPLHTSPAARRFGRAHGELTVTEDVSTRLLRLPFFADITHQQQDQVIELASAFLRRRESFHSGA